MSLDGQVEEDGADYKYQSKFDFVEAMRLRTKNLVLRPIKLCQALPATEEAGIMDQKKLASLKTETTEILKILAKARSTLRD